MNDADTGGAVAAVCEPGGDAAATLTAAAALARALGTGLVALAVVEPPSELARIAAAAGLAEATALDRLADEARARLGGAAAGIDPTPAIEVRLGKPFLEIVRLAVARDLAWVVKTADAPASALFASTDQHLLRKCPCPVWLRRPGDGAAPSRVVAAIDAEGEDQTGLNDRILATAGRLAALGGGPLYVVHAWEAPGEALVRRWASGPDVDAAAYRYTRSIRGRHEQALARALARAALPAGVSAEAELIDGLARDAVPAAVRRLGADCLVMGTLARTGVPGLIIGNTAEDILNAVACPVVTVKPPGYETPVR
ncbi:MAG: universal stress protein [Paracoccaceae bacterium]